MPYIATKRKDSLQWKSKNAALTQMPEHHLQIIADVKGKDDKSDTKRNHVMQNRAGRKGGKTKKNVSVY